MAPQTLTRYERQRLDNIKRNGEIMAALKLKLHSTVFQLSASSKRNRLEAKSNNVVSKKKPKTDESQTAVRRSLRTRGISPGSSKDGDSINNTSPTSHSGDEHDVRVLGPLLTRDAYRGDAPESEGAFIQSIKSSSSQTETVDGDVHGGVDLGSLSLEPENDIARILAGKILVAQWFPTRDMTMMVAGNVYGDIGFWDLNYKKAHIRDGKGEGIYVYRPHSAPVSGISVRPDTSYKIYTSSYDGLIRLMDAEKEIFDLVYSSDYAIYSLSQPPNDIRSVYFAEGSGNLNRVDDRSRTFSNSWNLHESKINSIDFKKDNPNIMATSSTDGTVGIWDLRSIDADKPKALKIFSHKRSVHSAYFSPSGRFLATTSIDDTIGLLSGVDFEDIHMIYHNNRTSRWISSFRAIWGWDDAYIFVGNMNRAVDVISSARKALITTLQSPHVSAIQCRFATHPSQAGILAGATSGGQVYVWRSC